MQELAFEYFLAAIEATRGTAEASPTQRFNLVGTLQPKEARYRPNESHGTLAAHHRSKRTRQWSEFDAEGPYDNNLAIVLFQSAIKGGVTAPTTPANGVLTRDWEFTPNMTSDDVEALTIWWGDRNIQTFRSGFCTIDEITIVSDATGEDGITMSIAGMGNFPTKVSNPTAPAINTSDLFGTMGLEAYIDTSSAIGTTQVTGRVVSAEHTITLDAVKKFIPAGAGASLDYTDMGRLKRFITTKITCLVPDLTQYDHFADDDIVKLRVNHNGSLIESVTPDYYEMLQVDTYGPLTLTDYGDYEGANRLLGFEVTSEYDDTLAADWRVMVRNQLTALPS